MGSSASKASRGAGSAARKYPTKPASATTSRPAAPPRAPPAERVAAQAGPTTHPAPEASTKRTEAIDLDARDTILGANLRHIGAVQPNPHFSPSSISGLDPRRPPSAHQSIPPSSQPRSFPSQQHPSQPQFTNDRTADQPPLPASAFPDPANNPAVRLLQARQRIQEAAEHEISVMHKRGFRGRKYTDVHFVRQALERREKGESDESIEDSLRLEKGRLGALGRGIVGSV